MRVIKRVFFTIIFFTLGISYAIAKGPPEPSPMGRQQAVAAGIPPPGLPIDENIFMGVIVAALFGIYIIYSFGLKTKTPM